MSKQMMSIRRYGTSLCMISLLTLTACSESPRPSQESTTRVAAPLQKVTSAPASQTAKQPLRGTINDVPLEGFKAAWENGILTLYTGEDPSFKYGTRLILFSVLEETANQSLDIDTAAQHHSASIHVNSKEHPELEEIIFSPIKLEIQSKGEKDYRVPVSMRLVAGKKLDIHLEGEFEIATSGLVAQEGIVDRSHDHIDTIEYVARRHVESRFPDQAVIFDGKQGQWMQNGGKKSNDSPDYVQAGGYAAVFRVDDGPRQISKMQLAKREEIWQVVNELGADQLYAAHPLSAPRRNAPPYIFSPLAARHFEQHYYMAEGGWEKLKEPMLFPCGGGQVEGQKGYCEVNYGVYFQGEIKINGSYRQVKCTTKTYLFKQQGEEWMIDQVLPAEKKFDRRTQEIIDRTGDVWSC